MAQPNFHFSNGFSSFQDEQVYPGLNNSSYQGPVNYFPQSYGHNGGVWNTMQFMGHERSPSDPSHTTSMGVQHPDSTNRRHSVPANAHHQAPNYPYQQRPIAQLMPPFSSIPGSLSMSSHSPTPQYTPQQSPTPSSQPGFDFQTGLLHSQFNQGNSVGPDTSYGGNGRRAAGRIPKSNSHLHPYFEPKQSPLERSPAGSSGQNMFEGSDYETSPGAESDSYCSFPNTPADTSGVMPYGIDRKESQKYNQKLKKRGDRQRENEYLTRVKELLGLPPAATKVDTLEKVIKFFGRAVPPRTNEPTPVLPGRSRTERATQVACNRRGLSQLFKVVGECMGYIDRSPPKRERLLEEVAGVIASARMRPLAP